MAVKFPGETQRYRKARNKLLKAELQLRKHIETVAAERRHLPLGGEVREDYLFEEGARDLSEKATVRPVRMSELFAGGKETLVLYSYMYGPKMKAPCPLCTSLIDGLNGAAVHAGARINFAIEAKSDVHRIREVARARGWNNLRLLSSGKTSFRKDYHGEEENEAQNPMMHAFVRRNGKIHHFWSSESLFSKKPARQDARHIDLFWPLWHLFDITPEGRGTNWYPQLSY